jgi:hypothetical protein
MFSSIPSPASTPRVAPSEDNQQILDIRSKFSVKKLKPEDRNPFVTGESRSIEFSEPKAIKT